MAGDVDVDLVERTNGLSGVEVRINGTEASIYRYQDACIGAKGGRNIDRYRLVEGLDVRKLEIMAESGLLSSDLIPVVSRICSRYYEKLAGMDGGEEE